MVTIDPLRCAENLVSEFLVDNYIFDIRYTSCVARWLLFNESVYRIRGLYKYADAEVKKDVMYLTRCLPDYTRPPEGMPWIPAPMVERAIRAEFRKQFFYNGPNHQYNFALTRLMFHNCLKNVAIDFETDMLRLRSLDDQDNNDDDDYDRGVPPFEYRILPFVAGGRSQDPGTMRWYGGIAPSFRYVMAAVTLLWLMRRPPPLRALQDLRSSRFSASIVTILSAIMILACSQSFSRSVPPLSRCDTPDAATFLLFVLLAAT